MLENQVAEIERTIQNINGIEAVRIVANGQGIEEIHVLSSPEKNVKQIARDIETAVIIKHGIAVDYRKISIGQISKQNRQVTGSARLRVMSVSVESSLSTCRVRVNLSFDDKIFEGIAEGSYSGLSKYRLVAEATLKAIEKACANNHLSFEGLELVKIGSRNAFVVFVTIFNDSGEQLGLGSALKTDGLENESVVKAALSSVNRRINPN